METLQKDQQFMNLLPFWDAVLWGYFPNNGQEKQH